VVLLGSPIGTVDFEDDYCLQRVKGIKKLAFLESENSVSIQARYTLLKDSLLPTLNYLLRTVPPHKRSNGVLALDKEIDRISKVLLGASEFKDHLAIQNSSQPFLPLRFGGLGLIFSSAISVAAYLGSLWESGVEYEWEYCSSLVERLRQQGVEISVEQLKNKAPGKKTQKSFTDQIMRRKFNLLLRALGEKDNSEEAKSRIYSAQQTGASDWLRILPSSPSRSFTDMQWKLAARLRLGLKLCRQETPQLCPL
jgi:hypothetical protein